MDFLQQKNQAYKQQLADSQRTINEMHLIIQNLEKSLEQAQK